MVPGASPSGTLIAWQKQQDGQQYTIARGDTLSGIAERFKFACPDLKNRNGISGEKSWWGRNC